MYKFDCLKNRNQHTAKHKHIHYVLDMSYVCKNMGLCEQVQKKNLVRVDESICNCVIIR